MYDDVLAELSEAKKKLKASQLDRNSWKKRAEYHERQNKARQKGEGLSKAAEDRIIRRRLQNKLSEAQLDIWLNDQKRSSKWSQKGILQIYLEKRSLLCSQKNLILKTFSIAIFSKCSSLCSQEHLKGNY